MHHLRQRGGGGSSEPLPPTLRPWYVFSKSSNLKWDVCDKVGLQWHCCIETLSTEPMTSRRAQVHFFQNWVNINYILSRMVYIPKYWNYKNLISFINYAWLISLFTSKKLELGPFWRRLMITSKIQNKVDYVLRRTCLLQVATSGMKIRSCLLLL